MIFISHLLPKLNVLNLMISGTENHFPSLCAKNEKNNNRVNSRENISEVFLRKYVTLKSSKSTRSPFWPHMIFVNFLFIDDRVNVEVEVHWVTLLNKYSSVID